MTLWWESEEVYYINCVNLSTVSWSGVAICWSFEYIVSSDWLLLIISFVVLVDKQILGLELFFPSPGERLGSSWDFVVQMNLLCSPTRCGNRQSEVLIV